MKTTISLNGMRFYAHHGCFEAERVVGTQFRVNLSFDADTSRAQQSDDIADTISYLDVYQAVKTQMQQPSNLLEHVAQRIITALAQQFPTISNITIDIHKLNPALGGEVGSASVTLRN